MTSEIITKQFKRGMTVEQIALLHEIEVEQINEIVKGVEVERTVEKPTGVKGRIPIDLKRVKRLLEDGLTLPQIAKELDVKYSTLTLRLRGETELKELAAKVRKETSRVRMEEMKAAKKEVAVTTESDGFAENYTIAHMTKEEADMTEVIAEVKQETEERNEPNDKWVHFVANQIDNARVKTKFDVVQEGKKFIKRTEVRFVIEEVL
ncbi:hypothetical protein [Exiguobacterium sp. S22-S28]|uniref:hypothetical protein n=1 Tax=Exiguobacterium sp. S22-S28 TaxID=3342768 RepID=UPI00372D0B6C